MNVNTPNPCTGPDAHTRDMVFRRLYVRGRSVAIGSADSGNVTNVLFDDCTIGDDAGSSPWAFKVKMHVNQPGTVSGITFLNTKFGNITASEHNASLSHTFDIQSSITLYSWVCPFICFDLR